MNHAARLAAMQGGKVKRYGGNMYILEYKQLYIVPEPLTKNRTCQSYRWKQYAMCEERQPLQDIIDAQSRPEEWRIEKHPDRPA